MRYHKFYLPAVLSALAIATAGCVDDNYDLSDIDTTTKLTVEDLVIPVNIAPVTLGDIITYDDNSKIKPTLIDGVEVYALTEEGDFKSKDISIKSFKSQAPTLNSSQATLVQFIPNLPTSLPSINPGDLSVVYDIPELGEGFDYTAEHIDDAIHQIYSAQVAPLAFKISLIVKNVSPDLFNMKFTDLQVQLPLGFKIAPAGQPVDVQFRENGKLVTETIIPEGKYDEETGIWSIESKDITFDPNDAAHSGMTGTTLYLVVTGIDFKAAGCQINDAARTLNFKGAFKVLSGYLTLQPNLQAAIPQEFPTSIDFQVDYKLSDLEAKTLSGNIQYSLEGMNIDPVSLADVPEFLTKTGTNIRLTNPQIYLQINNPVGRYNLKYTSGLVLLANRENNYSMDFMPNREIEVIPTDRPENLKSGPYNFVLSPKNEGLATPGIYADHLEWIEFSTLGDILSTQDHHFISALPQSIGIELKNPGIPTQDVFDFELGTNLPGVVGKYSLVAPIALEDGSVIKYDDETTGWFSDTTDDLVVTKLQVTAKVDNNIPLGASVIAFPLNRQGEIIQDVTIETTTLLEPSKANQDLTIVMKGKVENLDGVKFVATLKGNGSGALKPEQTINLSNIKARVSGYYLTKL